MDELLLQLQSDASARRVFIGFVSINQSIRPSNYYLSSQSIKLELNRSTDLLEWWIIIAVTKRFIILKNCGCIDQFQSIWSTNYYDLNWLTWPMSYYFNYDAIHLTEKFLVELYLWIDRFNRRRIIYLTTNQSNWNWIDWPFVDFIYRSSFDQPIHSKSIKFELRRTIIAVPNRRCQLKILINDPTNFCWSWIHWPINYYCERLHRPTNYYSTCWLLH
jgi:hypothetical protein